MVDGCTDEMIDCGDGAAPRDMGGPRPADPSVTANGATWHRVAPLLVAAGFGLVCPDMRGYGGSSKPEILPDHRQQSKRTVAQDLVHVMAALGHDVFSAVGHDRGCYVASRLALDHPSRVGRLVVMDGVPIIEAIERCDARFSELWYHWFFFAQPEKPERAIGADPVAWYRPYQDVMGKENYTEVLAAIKDPEVVRAMLEDIGPASPSTWRPTAQTGWRVGRSVARPCCSARVEMISRRSTATRWLSGAPGPLTFAAR